MTYNTDRRQAITVLLSSTAEALTAEEICDRLLGDGGGKSTVYRIISDLVDKGVIKRISDGHSRRVKYQYLGEKSCTEHLHLKCNLCGRLIHLDKEASESIISTIKCVKGFSLDPTDLLSGRCENCLNKA